MILSDTALSEALLCGDLNVIGLAPGALQPCSIDLRLGDEFAYWSSVEPVLYGKQIDFADSWEDMPQPTIVQAPRVPHIPVQSDRGIATPGFVIHPGCFALGHTIETVELRPAIAARVEGRSSIGRLGLVVHATAGFIDPGFSGQITLEFANLSPYPMVLRPGQWICQLAVETVIGTVNSPYGAKRGSKYSGQTGVKPSRWAGAESWKGLKDAVGAL